MELLIGNHAGLWALLGIPAVLLIHFIQQKSRRIHSSTLFLLESLVPESAEGRRFEWIRNSSSLWWQLLAVLLISWVLVEPRWVRRDSVQRVVILLDSSISMAAFKADLLEKLAPRIRSLGRSAVRTEWVLAQTDLSDFELYTGGDASALQNRISSWEPQAASHDPQPAFELTRKLAGKRGNIIFVTDRKIDLPSSISTIAVGRPIENCALIGSRVYRDGERWMFEALIRNYGKTTQKRSWWIESENSRSVEAPVELQPGGIVAIRGAFPESSDVIRAAISGDEFVVDDRLPLAIPRNKKLRYYLQPGLPAAPFVRRLLKTFDDLERSSTPESADLQFVAAGDQIKVPSGTLIAFHVSERNSVQRSLLPVIAERDPLIDDLHWDSLIAAPGSPAENGEFEPILWQGDRPLIMARGRAAGRALLVNFDLRISNADRDPSFIILLHRFIEEIRSALPRFERRNLEAGQSLGLAVETASGGLRYSFVYLDGTPEKVETLSPAQALVLQAPARPGVVRVGQGGHTLFEAAVSFGDPRESDFSEAGSADTTQEMISQVRDANTTDDLYLPLWLVVLGVVILLNWLSQLQPTRKSAGART